MTIGSGALGALIDEYVEALFEFNPLLGSYSGLHKYDAKLPDLRKASMVKRIQELKEFLVKAQAVEIDPADNEADLDKTFLIRNLNKELFELEELREFEQNPMTCGYLTDVSLYIKREYAPVAGRLETVIQHLAQLPQALAQGREILDKALAKPALETALIIFKGTIDYYEKDVTEQFTQHGEAALTARFVPVREQALQAIRDFIADLESRLPDAHNNYAIGPEKYHKMLDYGEMVDLPVAEVLRVGLKNLEDNQNLLRRIAESFAPGRPLSEVMQEMIKNHPTPESLIPDTAAKLEEVREFLIDQKIVSVPSEVRVKVKESPPFMRWAFASLDSPGPFEEIATDAYYYLTLVEPEWTEQQKEEWLTKFDYFTLQGVSIHEAYPGHYLHFLHFKQISRKLRRLSWTANYSYSYVEGWAHYTEQMMIEEGYGSEDPHYQMSQLAEALLRNARYVVSVKMHTEGMTVDEGTRFFMENAHMEETPAASESRRGTFDPGYLNYCLGKLLILKLREDYKQQQGPDFSLQEFHDRLLSYGAIPLPLVRKMMLAEENGSIL